MARRITGGKGIVAHDHRISGPCQGDGDRRSDLVGPEHDGERPTLEGIQGMLGVLHAQPHSFEVSCAIHMPPAGQYVTGTPFARNFSRFPVSKSQNSPRKQKKPRPGRSVHSDNM
jgi:hypothetical protein